MRRGLIHCSLKGDSEDIGLKCPLSTVDIHFRHYKLYFGDAFLAPGGAFLQTNIGHRGPSGEDGHPAWIGEFLLAKLHSPFLPLSLADPGAHQALMFFSCGERYTQS